MPLLRAEAEKLSNAYLEAGIIEELIDRDDMFAMLPFMQVNSRVYEYRREDETAMLAAIAGNTHVKFMDVNADIPEAAMSFTEETAKLRIMAGDVDLDRFLMTTMGDTNNQKAAQMAAKVKIIRSKFKNTLVNGDSSTSPLEFDGIKKMVATGQVIAAGNNGAPLAFEMLDELLAKVNYGADALIMNQKMWRGIKSMLRALNIQPEHIALPDVGIRVPVYDGVPILLNDYIASNEEKGGSGATCTSIYAARFNEADGFHGLYGGGNAGIVVEEIGIVQNRDATRTRVKWYCGTALKSTKSLARLEGIKLA